MSYTLRLATAKDAPSLSDLAARTFVDTYGHTYQEKDLSVYLGDAYEVERARSEIEEPTRYTVLLFAQGDSERPCGYAMLHDGSIRPGDSGPSEDYLEIKRVYIDKPHHGKGAAYLLMDHVMEIVREKRRKITWLAVRDNNFRGQKFYHKYGFVATGERVFVAGEAEDRDLILSLTPRTEA